MIWVTDTGVPIKVDMIYSSSNKKGERVTMQLTELNLRPQDPAVFDPPANLKLMDMSNMGNLGTSMNTGSARLKALPPIRLLPPGARMIALLDSRPAWKRQRSKLLRRSKKKTTESVSARYLAQSPVRRTVMAYRISLK